MDLKKNLFMVAHRPFTWEFQINKFKESPISDPEYQLPGRASGVYLSVQGKGELPENEVCVVFRIRKYFDIRLLKYRKEYDPPILIFTCIFSIIDVQGHEKFPRTLTFESDSKCSVVCEERYIVRSCILNNASECIQENSALTVKVEGSLEEWDEYYVPLMPHWFPSRYSRHFHVDELEGGLEVSLPEYSMHASYLLKHSKYFQDMQDAPLLESVEKHFPLRNEELPAFLCMLCFLETEKLVLYEATISDMYKIADKYGIPILLEKCRKYMEKYLPRNASPILKFATFYYDIELKRTVDSYVERNDNLETGNELDDDFVCDTSPVTRNLINTKDDFEKQLRNVWGKYTSQTTHEVINFIPLSEIGTDPVLFNFFQ